MSASYICWQIIISILSMFVGGFLGALIAIKFMLKEIRGGSNDG